MTGPSENVRFGFSDGLNFEFFHPKPPVVVYRRLYGHPAAVFYALKTEASRVQHQTLRADMFGNGMVLAQISVVGVADDGVENVFHMAAELVFAAGVRRKFGPRITRSRITQGRLERQLGLRQTAVGGLRFLQCGFGLRFGDFVGHIFEGVINQAV